MLNVTNLKEQIVRVHKVLWQSRRKLKNHFFNTWEVVEIRNSWKKTIFSSENKKLAYFLFVLASTKNVKEQTLKAHKVSWQVMCKLYDHFLGT